MKLLVVDDSIVSRKMLRFALEGNQCVSMVDSAASAFGAREKIKEQNYDLIISDVNMPEESGVDLLKSLIQKNVKTPVLFFTSMSTSAIHDSLDLLGLGCLDVIEKPNGKSPDEVVSYIRSKVFPYLILKNKQEPQKEPVYPTVEEAKKCFPDIVACLAVGASTGGPAAVESFLKNLGAVNVPIFISIHMPRLFTESFANRLDSVSDFPVRVAKEGETIESGVCYLARGGDSMKIVKIQNDIVVKYVDTPGPGMIFPSVDILFDSLGEIYGSKCVGITLTGMGKDGLEGTISLKKNKGVMYIQDEESSVVFGMPGAIFENNLADGVFPLNELPLFISQNLKRVSVK